MMTEDLPMAKMTKAEKARAAARRRRNSRALNLMNVAEAYVQTSIWSKAAFKMNPWAFITSNEPGEGTRGDQVTLKELFNRFNEIHGNTGLTEGELVWKNLNDGWFNATLMTIGTGFVFRIAKKTLSKPRNLVNAFAKNQLGITEVKL